MGPELLLLVSTGPGLRAAGPRSPADEKLSEGERPPTSGMSEAVDPGPDLAMMLVSSDAIPEVLHAVGGIILGCPVSRLSRLYCISIRAFRKCLSYEKFNLIIHPARRLG